MAIHSSTLAWRVHRTEETGRLQSIGWQKWDTGEVTERSGIGIQLIYTSLETISGFPGGSGSKVSAWNAGDWVQSLGWDDPLEKEMATHSSTLAQKTPRMEEPGSLQSMGSQRVGHDRATSPHFRDHFCQGGGQILEAQDSVDLGKKKISAFHQHYYFINHHIAY